MHMHPTVTHAAADHRRQDYLAEAAVSWKSRPAAQQLAVRRRTHLIWRVTTVLDRFLIWRTREFTPIPQAIEREPHPSQPVSV